MKKILAVLLLSLFLNPSASTLWAQQDTAGTDRDVLYLNTIGSFSAGFVLQSYGYIGLLADSLSKGVYEPQLVNTMLGETINYLNNVNNQLNKYQQGAGFLAQGDKNFIASISRIVGHLTEEAQALSAFATSKNKEDLERYEDARKSALTEINRVFNMK